jgi:hypothetical protein
MIFNCTQFHLSKCNDSWVVSIKQNLNFNFQPPTTFVFFVSLKSNFTKSCSSFEEISAYIISEPRVDWCKFCNRLRSLNVRHFGMVVTTRLKLWHRGRLQRHGLPTEFHENLPFGSKIDGGQHTYTQAGRWSHKPTFSLCEGNYAKKEKTGKSICWTPWLS